MLLPRLSPRSLVPFLLNGRLLLLRLLLLLLLLPPVPVRPLRVRLHADA